MRQTSPSNAWPVLAVLVLLGCACSPDSKGALDSGTLNDSGTPHDDATDSDSSTVSGDAQVLPARAVTGPVEGGKGQPFTASIVDLAAVGYTEQEFFLEGTATGYVRSGGTSMDGKWTLMEVAKAAFKTRLLVRRPIDRSRFNGTVVVEWFNVSAGIDACPGFNYNADLLLREGYAWVGVSAQAEGVIGGVAAGGPAIGPPLTMEDPERYGSLYHPGNGFSFDIFSQVGEVLRNPEQVDVLEGLEPQRLIAYGQSQSAIFLVAYVNGFHPMATIYDGYFIHSRSGWIPALDQKPRRGFGEDPVTIRDDIEAKVFQFQTEADVTGMLMFLPARQPDSDSVRTWEVAGTAHGDKYIIDFSAGRATETGFQCPGGNDGPASHVVRAALHALDRWLRDGVEPARGTVLGTDSAGHLLQDEHGNALGGIRSPDVEVPIRTLSGDPPAGPSSNRFCTQFGSMTPFSTEKLMSLYPTHDDYVTKVKQSASKLRDAGFLLGPEATAFVSAAEMAGVPR